jgi:isochorismate hydrolase
VVDFAIIPERTALLKVDMQNYFVEGTPFSAPTGWQFRSASTG